MFKRVFVLVFDSLGIGNGKDAAKFDDVGSDTLKSVLESGNYKELDCLRELGFLNMCSDKKYHENPFLLQLIYHYLLYYFYKNDRQ